MRYHLLTKTEYPYYPRKRSFAFVSCWRGALREVGYQFIGAWCSYLPSTFFFVRTSVNQTDLVPLKRSHLCKNCVKELPGLCDLCGLLLKNSSNSNATETETQQKHPHKQYWNPSNRVVSWNRKYHKKRLPLGKRITSSDKTSHNSICFKKS